MHRSLQFQNCRRYLPMALAWAASLTLASPSHAAYDQIPAFSERMCPTHEEGDREFNGNGPDVYTSLYLLYDPARGVELLAYMNQQETRGDLSEAELLEARTLALPRGGSEAYTHVWKPDSRGVYRWQPISASIDHFSDRYVDQDVRPRTLASGSLGASNFWLAEVTTNGDTRGNDIGACTADDAYLTVRTQVLYVGYLCSSGGC